MKIQLTHRYSDIISLENLFSAWQDFVVGKKSKPDVQLFSLNLMDNILSLHNDLVNRIYCHGGYKSFFINDPKRRHIHKANVRDRLLHHAVYRILYPFFDHTFIADSFSCRNNKGIHKAINRFRDFSYVVSKNHTRTCWVLKCDIKQFFASIDQTVLLSILNQYIPDKEIMVLLKNIMDSFHTEEKPNVGLPLGNLTSQLLANVYLNVFDQWVKHNLKSRYYVRYADDFVFLSEDKEWLETAVFQIQEFLANKLHLSLHPDKVSIGTIASGVDFLGWVLFPDHRIMRNKTKKRMFMKMRMSLSEGGLQSYLGLLTHGNTEKIHSRLLNECWLWQ